MLGRRSFLLWCSVAMAICASDLRGQEVQSARGGMALAWTYEVGTNSFDRPVQTCVIGNEGSGKVYAD